MKKYYFILLILFGLFIGNNETSFAQSGDDLVEICNMIAREATYLKDFKVKLDAGDPAPSARYSLVLSKNVKYRMTICNSRDYDGQSILELFDNNRLLASTYVVATGKDYPFFDFKCQKTGVYHLIVKFKDGKEGLSVALLSYVENF